MQELKWFMLFIKKIYFVWVFCCFLSFEWLLVGFGLALVPEKRNLFLYLMGRAGFARGWSWRNPVDFTVSSCCGLIFSTAIILFMGGKKPAFPLSLDNYFVPPNHFPGVSDENKLSL